MCNYKPVLLLEFVRNGLIEQCHCGFVLKMDYNRCVSFIGEDFDYPFFLRSCAKPLQAALIFDFALDSFYDMSLDEIAICSASHAGENCHIDVVKSFINKTETNEADFKCGIHKPLSKTRQNEMLIRDEKLSVLHNNCSGKHAMMIALCKKNGWDISDYDNINHPLQLAIKDKIYSLCELKKDYPCTKDGCGVPIYSMPLKSMLTGYLNLFSDEKYAKLKNAFLNNPSLIGGEDRLDTAIISSSDSLIAKVGAGGLCIVVNCKLKQAILIKIMDCDMRARAIVTIEALKQLGWIEYENDLLIKQNDKNIMTLHNEKIGEAKICFKIK